MGNWILVSSGSKGHIYGIFFGNFDNPNNYQNDSAEYIYL